MTAEHAESSCRMLADCKKYPPLTPLDGAKSWIVPTV